MHLSYRFIVGYASVYSSGKLGATADFTQDARPTMATQVQKLKTGIAWTWEAGCPVAASAPILPAVRAVLGR